MNDSSQLNPEQLLAVLEAVITDAPAFRYQQPFTEVERRWLGRAEAIIEACDSMPALVEVRLARQSLGSYAHDRDALLLPLHTCYSRIELRAPLATRGAFILAGDTWNGYATLRWLV